jgi:hypothetical protein
VLLARRLFSKFQNGCPQPRLDINGVDLAAL